MSKDKPQPDSMINVTFPIRGIDVANPFDLQPPFTTPIGDNVRGYEPLTLRARGGQRPGLLRYLPPLPTNGLIQHLEFIVDPQADALTADFDEDVYPFIDYMDDPSTNNRFNAHVPGAHIRNPGPRRIRRGGSGRQPNINVQRSEITITWGNPADIIVGTPLSGIQLNATASSGILAVPGTFAYSPSAGAILPEGNGQSLSVTFTPTDTGLYRSASKTVSINVTADAGVTITNVQGLALSIDSGTGTSSTITVNAGSLFIVAVKTVIRDDLGSDPVITVSDTIGNLYSQIGNYTASEQLDQGGLPAHARLSLWSTRTSSGGSCAFTVLCDTAFAGGTAVVSEFSGIASATPIGSADNAESGLPVQDGYVASVGGIASGAADLAVAFFGSQNGNSSLRQIDCNVVLGSLDSLYGEWKVVAAPSSPTLTITLNLVAGTERFVVSVAGSFPNAT